MLCWKGKLDDIAYKRIRLPLVLGYAIFTGLKRLGKSLPKDQQRTVNKDEAMHIFHSIYRDIYGMHSISNVFIEAALQKLFIDASILTPDPPLVST
jgi:hypothetical protein